MEGRKSEDDGEVDKGKLAGGWEGGTEESRKKRRAMGTYREGEMAIMGGGKDK